MERQRRRKRKGPVRREVEECVVLDTSWLLQNGYFELTVGDLITRTVNWETWMWQRLFTTRLRLARPTQDELRLSLDATNQFVVLRPTPLRYGGLRWWFDCPSCWERCAKLYKPPVSLFACRRCHKLTYRSCNQGGVREPMTFGEMMMAEIKAANRRWRRKRDRHFHTSDSVDWYQEVFGDRIVV